MPVQARLVDASAVTPCMINWSEEDSLEIIGDQIKILEDKP